MFWKIFRMDLKRGFQSRRFVIVVLAVAVLLIVPEWEHFMESLQETRAHRNEMLGAIDYLSSALVSNVFGVAVILLLSGLYTGSFCQEENHHYLRMILNRVDVRVYTISRFLANTVVIVTAFMLASWVCILVYLSAGYSLVGHNMLKGNYYQDILDACPVVYAMMMGLQFGMIAALCSSVGILWSVYQPNAFVSIAISGFLFMFLRGSGLLYNTPFDVLTLIAMWPVLPGGFDVPRGLSFAWAMLYPLTVVALCGFFFAGRMKWRAKNGII